jgi:1-deoxy-D-xylulose-5-phosphate reductoisomerase
MKKTPLLILGSTGSIGRQTLEVVQAHPDRFEVLGLSACGQMDRLREQIQAFHPRVVAIGTSVDAKRLQKEFPQLTVFSGEDALCQLAAWSPPKTETTARVVVVMALAGAIGIEPVFHAMAAGHDIALATKEVLVVAGALIQKQAKLYGVRILPIDSEHSAIAQCLGGHDLSTVKRLILTASGGPFRDWPREKLQSVTVDAALKHPNWSMGKKITIDSATMMNKGLEVIEAHWLFALPASQIEVVIHPQSIVHSMVEFVDGAVIAQLGTPDMKLPIQYALNGQHRWAVPWPTLDFRKKHRLDFEPVDTRRFPCLALAYSALHTGGSMPLVLNAANEVAVSLFLEQKMTFLDIPRLVEKVMNEHTPVPVDSLSIIRELDLWAREEAQRHMVVA